MATELDEREATNSPTSTNGTNSSMNNGGKMPHVKGDVVAFIGPGVEFKGVISYQGKCPRLMVY